MAFLIIASTSFPSNTLPLEMVFPFEHLEMILTLHTFVTEKGLLCNAPKEAKWKGVHKSWIIPIGRTHRKWWLVLGTNVLMPNRCECLQLCPSWVIKWDIRVRFTSWLNHSLSRQSQTNYERPYCDFIPINLNTGCLLFKRELLKIVQNSLVIAQLS